MPDTPARRGRISVSVIALAAVSVLALSACGDPEPRRTAAKGGTLSVAILSDITSLNSATPQGNEVTNGTLAFLTGAGHFAVGKGYKLDYDTTYGSIEKLSDSPLTVKYTINKGQKWSDGEPATAADMFLSWAISSGYYDANDCNNPAGEYTPAYFKLAGGTSGTCQTTMPIVSDDNQSITVSWTKPYVDWQLVSFGGAPAHIYAKRAGLASAAEVTALLKRLPAGTANGPVAVDPSLKKMADFFNTAYDVTSMPTDKDLLVVDGPYQLSEWTPGQSITLSRNPNYTGGRVPKLDRIVLRVIADPTAQITALKNGEVDIVQPPATPEALAALDKSGANVIKGTSTAYLHLDLNFKSPVFADLAVRQAFLKTVPREKLLDLTVRNLDPEAKALNSQLFIQDQEPYAQAVRRNGYAEAYGAVDIEGAKKLLAGRTPTVRVLYGNSAKLNVDRFALIRASAEQAGFKVVDGGVPDLGKGLSGRDFEAAFFSWVSPGVGHGGIPQKFSTAGGGNYGSFSAANDLALETQSTLDPAKLVDLQIQIDTITQQQAFGLPILQAIDVWGVAKRVNGVEFLGGTKGPLWNYWNLSISSNT